MTITAIKSDLGRKNLHYRLFWNELNNKKEYYLRTKRQTNTFIGTILPVCLTFMSQTVIDVFSLFYEK